MAALASPAATTARIASKCSSKSTVCTTSTRRSRRGARRDSCARTGRIRARLRRTEAHTNVLSISAYEVHRLWQPDLYWQKIVAASDQSPTDGLGETL